MKLTKIGEFLKRSKIPIDIEDDIEYNRVTIRINHNGVSLRDSEIGKNIGTKKQFILKAGQFIVSKIDARYGAFGVAPEEVEGAIITGNFWAYDVDKKKVNIEWFNQFTNSADFYDICERASSGITHRKYLDEKFFLNYEILLPTVDEQLIQIEKIKSQKNSFNELSTELTHQLTLVKKLRQQLLQDAVQGKLVEQSRKHSGEPARELLQKIKAEKEKLIAEKKLKKEKELPPIKPEEIPFEIPENWVWCRLGDLVEIYQNGISSRGTSDATKAIVLRLADIKNSKVDLSDTREINLPKKTIEKHKLEESDILITRVNGSVELVGNFNYVGTHNLNITACDHFIKMRLVSHINTYFIYLLGKSKHTRKSIESQFKTTSGQKTINQGHINNLVIPLPPLAEQTRIVKKLDELMQYCNELEASIKQCESQNEKLLQQVLREALRRNGSEQN